MAAAASHRQELNGAAGCSAARWGRRPLLAGLGAACLLPVFPNAARAADPPPFRGDSRPFTLIEPPQPLPETLAFTTLDGAPASLRDLRGRHVLLNWWATWCPPCVKEMPSLLRLQSAYRPEQFRVVAVSVDRGGANAVEPYVMQHQLDTLELWLDPKMASYGGVKLRGLPTTQLLDPAGREIGRLEGAAAWDSPEALALIRHFVGDGGGKPTPSSPYAEPTRT